MDDANLNVRHLRITCLPIPTIHMGYPFKRTTNVDDFNAHCETDSRFFIDN